MGARKRASAQRRTCQLPQFSNVGILLSRCPRDELVRPLVQLRPKTAEIRLQASYIDAARTGSPRRAHRFVVPGKFTHAKMSLMNDPRVERGRSALIVGARVWCVRLRSGRRGTTLCARLDDGIQRRTGEKPKICHEIFTAGSGAWAGPLCVCTLYSYPEGHNGPCSVLPDPRGELVPFRRSVDRARAPSVGPGR